MNRPVVDFEEVTEEQLADITFHEPARVVLPNPMRGGLSFGQLRKVLAPKGRVRISGTTLRTFVDIDPGEPEPPLIALDTIARSDAAGLERMILSVAPHVDEIVIGIDGRSDEETLRVAQAYADCAFVFEALDIGMTGADWIATSENPRGKIDFSAARNLGRSRVQAPWSFVVDSDEYVARAANLRKIVQALGDDYGGCGITVQMGAFEHHDVQRLARTRYRWTAPTHNQLLYSEKVSEAAQDATLIVCDTSMREADEQARRNAQREVGVTELVEEAARGNLVALFHLAKHRAGGTDLDEAARLVVDFRSRIMPHTIMGDERVWAALSMGFRYYNEDKLDEAEMWAARALLDGPRLAAFCLLGDIAECQGDLVRARGWFECACAVTEKARIEWPGLTELRFGRLSGIKAAMLNPESASTITIEEGDEPSASAPTLLPSGEKGEAGPEHLDAEERAHDPGDVDVENRG